MIYVSSSCVQHKKIKDSVLDLVSNGFKNIELSGGTEYYDGFEYELLELKDKYSLNYICHNYFPPPKEHFVLNLASQDHEVYTKTLNHLKQAIVLFDSFYLTNRGLFSPQPIFKDGFSIVVWSLVIAIVVSYFVKRFLKSKQEASGKQYPIFLINSAIIIFTPIIFYYIMGMPLEFDSPVLKGFNFKGGMVIRPEFLGMLFGLSIYTAAFISETVRSGIISVSKGQREASQALGLKSNLIMRLVIIPQALRVIIPPLTSQYLNLTKNSSLGIAIGYADLVHGFGGISLNQTGRAIEIMLMVMLTYLTISLTISFFMNIYNKSVQFKGNA